MRLEIAVNLRELERLEKIAPEVVRREMRTVLGAIAARVEKEVVEKTPRGVGAQGGLAGSIHGEVVTIGQGMAAVIGTPIGYGEVVELGRRPGKMPPLEPIALWAERKLGVSREDSMGVAYLIAQKIAWYGTEGAHMFERTKEELDGWIMQELVSIAARVARRLESGTG